MRQKSATGPQAAVRARQRQGRRPPEPCSLCPLPAYSGIEGLLERAGISAVQHEPTGARGYQAMAAGENQGCFLEAA